MSLYYDRAEIKIDLDALKFNIIKINELLNNKTQIIAVVKTDAYGHGANAIASFLEPLKYVWGFAVATVEEGITLRREGITKPILVLGATFPCEIKKSVSYNLTNNIFDVATAKMLSNEATLQNKMIDIHIAIDSGMGRLGFRNIEKDLNDINEIYNTPNLNIKGVLTHFSKADDSQEFTLNQIKYFDDMISKLEEIGITNVLKHSSNSAGTINKLGTNFDAIRLGIAMYGLSPFGDKTSKQLGLKPVLSLSSKIIFVKDIEASTPISYGGTFVSDKKMKVATVPIGYGDGYPRSLSSLGYVLIKGHKAKILGRICMDQFMVDVSDIDGVGIGDNVTLVGEDGDFKITIDELSDLSGRFNYEFVCDLNKRIPRVYYSGEDVIDTMDYFYK